MENERKMQTLVLSVATWFMPFRATGEERFLWL